MAAAARAQSCTQILQARRLGSAEDIHHRSDMFTHEGPTGSTTKNNNARLSQLNKDY